MTKRKICVVISARPSYSRIKSALNSIKNHPKLELQLVVSGSALLDKYGKVSNVIEKDGFKISKKVYNLLEGDEPVLMAKTTGLAIIELSSIFETLKPDVVVSIADRFETIATSIASSYQNIPLAHIQGGEVTGNIDEKVRHANTKLADIHLVASEDAKNRVIKMGEISQMVINTGCPSIDIAREVLKNPKLNFDPIKKYGGVGPDIDWKKEYLVVMQHPVTTDYKKSKKNITETLKAIHKIGIPTFWFWPNVDAGSDATSSGIRKYREHFKPKNIYFFKNMEPQDFLRLIKNSVCLVGNSSAGIRECSFLGVPVINIGDRQNQRLKGKNVINCSYSNQDIIKNILKIKKNGHYHSEHLYGDGYAGENIAKVLSNCKLNFHKTITY
jgi:UDP-hydrolysing UDP-N-acetyl-D-glucosamine 2-epimerase